MLSIPLILSRLKTSQTSARFRVRLRLNRYLLDYRTAFASSDLLFPHRHEQDLRLAVRLFGAIRGYHVPRGEPNGLGTLYPPMSDLVCDAVKKKDCVPTHVPFWFEPVSIFGSFWLTTFIKDLHMFAIPLIPSPLPP